MPFFFVAKLSSEPAGQVGGVSAAVTEIFPSDGDAGSLEAFSKLRVKQNTLQRKFLGSFVLDMSGWFKDESGRIR